MASQERPGNGDRLSVREARDEAAVQPSSALSMAELGQRVMAAHGAGRYGEARDLLKAMIAQAPAQPSLKFALAQLTFHRFEQADEALALLDEALALDPRAAHAHEYKSSIHLMRGETEPAVEAARRGLDIDPGMAVCYLNLMKLRPELGAELEPMLRRALAAPPEDATRRRQLHAALGQVLDKAGAYDEAFEQFAAANASGAGAVDLELQMKRLQEAQALFDRDFFADRAGHGLEDDRMAFIVGLPRSGSTLIERVIDAHPDASGAGERAILRDLNNSLARRHAERGGRALSDLGHIGALDATAARQAATAYLTAIEGVVGDPRAARWVDKTLGAYAYAPLIALMLPRARILHARRSLLDTAVSCFMTVFEEPLPFTESLLGFAHHAIVYQELMKLWRRALGDRVIDIDYETLASAPEAEAQRIIGGLGLPWDAGCARPHEKVGLVMTASASQVRKPVYTSSIGRWRNYEKQLQPLIQALESYNAIEDAA